MDIVKGDIVQHFKHDPKNGKWHIYEVLAIAQPLPREPIGLPFVCEATHTEAGILLKVCQLGERYFIGALPSQWVKPHVIYSNTRESGVWARPLHHFNEPMEDGRSRFTHTSRGIDSFMSRLSSTRFWLDLVFRDGNSVIKEWM